jgi:hypothetical protein
MSGQKLSFQSYYISCKEITLESCGNFGNEVWIGRFIARCSAIVYAQCNERQDSSSAKRKMAKLKDSSTEISTGPDNLEITDSQVITRDFFRPSLLTSRIIFLKTSNYISLSSEIGCKTKFRIRKDPKWALVFVTLRRKHYWHFNEEKSVTDR